MLGNSIERLRRRIARAIEARWRPISAAHLESQPVVPRNAPADAQSITEPDMPRRRRDQGLAISPLLDFVKWADVENPRHLRWRPAGGLTYCNIYAHDYCHAAGVYLPRVWWNRDALESLRRGQKVRPVRGETVYEMDTNGFCEWLPRWGAHFGWQRVRTLDKLQAAANRGAVAMIVAPNHDWHAPGHVTMVLPETAGHTAYRRDGRVVWPLQSEAGAMPLMYGTGDPDWWLGARFKSFQFYCNFRRSIW